MQILYILESKLVATIKRFEDLECWQEGRKLVNMVYGAINNGTDFQKDFRLNGQTTGAAISVMNNIAGSAP